MATYHYPDKPETPANGDLYVVNGKTFSWNATTTVWDALSSADNALRPELAATDSAVLVGGVAAGRIAKRLDNAVHISEFMLGGVTDSGALQAAIDDGRPVDFTGAELTLTEIIEPKSGMVLFSRGGDLITSTIAAAPATYNQIFVTSETVSNIVVDGLRFHTSSEGFNVFGFYLQASAITIVNCKTTGCGIATLFRGGVDCNISNNHTSEPAHTGYLNPYARVIQINCLFTGTGTKNVHVKNNTILGNWTHGIEISGNDVMDELDPFVAKNINGVVLSGNIVVADAQTHTAGAIWISQAANVVMSSNVCENYGDVGLDVEASTNVVVVGNTLRNNNKNLAMYGNSMDVIFKGNACYNTIPGLSMFYAKPANENGVSYLVDSRNTNIVIDNNIFHNAATVTGFERIELGSGESVRFTNNILKNVGINASYMSLTDMLIEGNNIDINANGADIVPILVQQSYQEDDPNTAPFYAKIKNNRVILSNAPGTAFGILYQDGDTAGATVDFDKNLVLRENVVEIDPSKFGIYVQQSSTITPTKRLNVEVTDNTCWGLMTFNETGNREVIKSISDNKQKGGIPYSVTKASSGVLDTFETSLISTVGSAGVVSFSLADGDHTGQRKKIVMSGFDTNNGVVIIAKHRLGISQNAVFSSVGQFAMLEWNVNAWDTVSATCSGIS